VGVISREESKQSQILPFFSYCVNLSAFKDNRTRVAGCFKDLGLAAVFVSRKIRRNVGSILL